MTFTPNTRTAVAMAAMVALAVPISASAQELGVVEADNSLTVNGMVPAEIADLPDGPEVEGFISARAPEKMQVTTLSGAKTVVFVSPATDIRSKGGFLGLSRTSLGADSLLNGLPVTVETKQWGDNLIASKVRLSNNDLETAQMIRTGTEQGFAEQTAATDALRGRVADIDNYNIRGVTNVYFDTNKWNLTPAAERELCQTVSDAKAMDNAQLLVVGYTDADGSQEYNQVLSERRANKVVNFIQQQCGWQPWRMKTPTGMSEADPAADNTTEAGKAQNRRVAVNILVSKAVEGL